MPQPFKATTFFVIFLTFGLFACNATLNPSKNDALNDTLRAFERVVRWGHLGQMYRFLQPADEPPDVPEHLGNIRVTGYHVINGPLHLKDESVRQDVLIEYLYRDQQVIKSVADKQLWQKDPENGRWLRTSPIPEFK